MRYCYCDAAPAWVAALTVGAFAFTSGCTSPVATSRLDDANGAQRDAPSGPLGDDGFALTAPEEDAVLVHGLPLTVTWVPQPAARVNVVFTNAAGEHVVVAREIENNGETRIAALDAVTPMLRNGGVMRVVSSDATLSAQPPAHSRHVNIGGFATFVENPATHMVEYGWVQPTTGTTHVLARLPTAEVDPHALVSAPAQGRIYAIGRTRSDEKIYAIPVRGESSGNELIANRLSGVPADVGALAGFTVTAAGELLAFGWNDRTQKQVMVAIDPLTGRVTGRGTLGDLLTWSGQAIAARSGDALFVLGNNGREDKLYVVNARTGAMIRQLVLHWPDDAPPSGLALNAAGDLLGIAWNQALQRQQLVKIQPATGATTVLGALSDLQTWDLPFSYNASNQEIYVWGTNAAGTAKLYTMNAVTGAVVSEAMVAPSVRKALLVY